MNYQGSNIVIPPLAPPGREYSNLSLVTSPQPFNNRYLMTRTVVVLQPERWDFKSLNPSKTRSLRLLRGKAQVKTRVFDGLEFSKNQPSWGFLSLRLESLATDLILNFVKSFIFVHLKSREWSLLFLIFSTRSS